jgi:hypothetical protein
MFIKLKNFNIQIFKTNYFNFARKNIPAKNTLFSKFTNEYEATKKRTIKELREKEHEMEVKLV